MRFSPTRLSPLLAILAVSMLPSPAAAELMIAPTRVVLSGAERSTELILVNKSDQQTAYRIDVENRRMRNDGALETATDTQPGELFAADMIRFSPRRVPPAEWRAYARPSSSRPLPGR